jgi:hypothetical protein
MVTDPMDADLLVGHEPTPTLRDQIACVERELGLRERVYPVWIERGKLKKTTARIELIRMGAVLHTLKELEIKFIRGEGSS